MKKNFLLVTIVTLITICFIRIEAKAGIKSVILEKGDTYKITGEGEFCIFDSIDVYIPNAKGSGHYDLFAISSKRMCGELNRICDGETIYNMEDDGASRVYYVTCIKSKIMISDQSEGGKKGIQVKKLKKSCFNKYILKKNKKITISGKSDKGTCAFVYGNGSKVKGYEKKKGKINDKFVVDGKKQGTIIYTDEKRSDFILKNTSKKSTLILVPNYYYSLKVTGGKRNNQLIDANGKMIK